MIGIDWGTSNFRAFRFDDAGEMVDRRFSPEGILAVPVGGFAEALSTHVGDWLLAGERRVILCGMVGSRQGWLEAEYLPCPAGLEELVSAVAHVPFAQAEVFLVPGVVGADADGVPEVMRGEETEVMGLHDGCGREGLVCLPGTHSKWIDLRDGKIVSFRTCMTGEVFAALRSHTILSRLMTGSVMDEAAFLRGVARSEDGGGLLHHLFGVRSLGLMNQLKETESASYLSGLLIGHEVRAAMPEGGQVHLVGDVHLCSLYERVIAACGGSSTQEEEHAGARGLAAIGLQLPWRVEGR